MIEFKKLALLTEISFTLLYSYAYTLILSDVRKQLKQQNWNKETQNFLWKTQNFLWKVKQLLQQFFDVPRFFTNNIVIA